MPNLFVAAGYTVPQTWDELLALTQMIADDGDPAWCIGIESGAATGWPATDWTEETMLRTTSLENYDAWVRGELDFASPEVTAAIEAWSEIWFNPDFVFGGTDGIVSTNFGDSPAPMFEDPPGCWLHKQGNFITGFFPEGTEAGVDYDFFYLPRHPAARRLHQPCRSAGQGTEPVRRNRSQWLATGLGPRPGWCGYARTGLARNLERQCG